MSESDLDVPRSSSTLPATVLAALGPDGPVLADPDAPLLRADDPGVLRGESVFESLRLAAGRPAFLHRHLRRLEVSAERLGLELPGGWEALVELAVGAWARPAGVLRLVCSRGGTAYALVTAIPPENAQARALGIRVVTLDLGVPAGLRAHAPWLLGGVKSTSYAVNMAAQREARRIGADDAVLLSSDGEVLEAPTATVAWVVAGRLVTPPPQAVGILAGITMEVVLELCDERGIGYEVRRGTVAELRAADEVLLAGSIRGIAPVVALDERTLAIGPVTAGLRDSFEQRVLRAE